MDFFCSSPKGSSASSNSSSHHKASSSSVSRNPPSASATPQTYNEILHRFQTLWSNEINNGVHQEQRFPYMGSSSSTNPYMGFSSSTNLYMGSSSTSSTIAEDEFQRYNAFKKNNRPSTTTINGGGTLLNSDNVGNNYLSSMNYSSLGVNKPQLSNGYTTLEDQISLLGSINYQDLDVRNLRCKLIESKGWPVEKVLKIWYNDPTLLDEIKPDDIVMVAELKLGSLYLQRILKDQDPLYFNMIFDATLEYMFRLMTNSEGTYVIRKLHSLCSSSHMKEIVSKICSQRDDLKYAARNEAGADTLAKLIRVLKSTYPLFHKYVLDSLTSEICVDIMRSKPGSNLFKSCLQYLDSRQNEILHKRVATRCIDMATDESGYFSLIALIENTPNPYKEELLFKISDKAVCLSQDPKGNYVIQAILKLGIPKVDLMICRNLVGTYCFLSTHKCASNVVEKCIMSSGMEYPILELILSHKLHLLSQDPMGNYVVQKALAVSQQLERLDLYDSIVGEIRPYLKDLLHHPIGLNVFKKINNSKVLSKFVQCPISM